MKKTLIALTLATLPVAAMAEVVLYGQIKAGYELNSTKVSAGNASATTPNQNGIVDFGSRIGLKGKEDLGNGLNAIWQVEQRVGVDGGQNYTFGTRDSFIGLEGNFGKVRAGLLSNYQNDSMQTPDVWEYSSAALGLDKYVRTGVRRAAIRYDSPTFAGFSFATAYSPSDNNNASVDSRTTVRPNESKDAYNLGLSYENAGFFAKYAYEYQKNARNHTAVSQQVGTRNGQIHNLEAGYDANNLFVAGGYQYTRNAAQGTHLGTVGARSQEVVVTAGYHFGNVFPKISYAHGFNLKDENGLTLNNTKYDQIVLGADYDFSKRTTAMVSAGWLREGLGQTATNQNVKATTKALGVGLRHKF